MEKKYDVVALGELLIDFTEHGVSDQGNPLWEANPGGAPCNVLAMLQKLGRRTAFIGKIGRDVYGDQLRRALIETGIDTAGLLTDEKVHTTLAIVHKRPNGDRDFSFYREPGADMMLRYEEVPTELLTGAKIFHFGTLSMTHEGNRDATKRALETARNAGALISFDPNLRPPLWSDPARMREQMEWGLAHSDIVKISDDEVTFLTGLTDYEKGAARIRARFPGIKLLCITAGPSGSFCSFRDLFVYAPAFLLDETVETTGAGDTFCACVNDFVLSHGVKELTKEDLIGMITFAGAAAALVTTKKGALRVMPEKAEVEALIARES